MATRTSGAAPGPETAVGPREFVAVRPLAGSSGKSGLTVSDARTGRIERVLLPNPWHGMTVDETAVDPAGRIWATLSQGPRCSSGLAGCGPVAGSCSGQIVRLSTTGGAPSVVLTASANELIADAQPSPNRRLVAYLDGVCNRSYFNQYLRVRDLGTGRSWTIGASLAPCHTLGSISWTADGRHLVVAYGASTLSGRPTGNEGAGLCSGSRPTEIAVVPALAAAPGLPGAHSAVDPDCEVAAVTAIRNGYAALEACGASYLSGPVSLLRDDLALHVTARQNVGRCADGAQLRVDASGTDLIGSSYQFCNPPGNQGPRTVTFTVTGSRGAPRTIVDAPNHGSDSVGEISW